MSELLLVVTVLLMSLVTMLPRVLPLLIATRVTLTARTRSWVRHIPVAAISALLVPELFSRNDGGAAANLYLWVALPTALVAMQCKHFLVTIVAGVSFMAIARWLFLS
jgi:branched-subunit amino acid transport protein